MFRGDIPSVYTGYREDPDPLALSSTEVFTYNRNNNIQSTCIYYLYGDDIARSIYK